MKRLKIALFEPTRIPWGGGQIAMANTAAYLSTKHDVTLFTPRTLDKRLDFKNCKIEIIKPLHLYLQPLAFLLQNFANLDRFDLKIVGCFPATLCNLRKGKIPSIHVTHSPPRIFYELKKHFLKNNTLLGKLKLHTKYIFLKRLDHLASQKHTRILGISKEVKRRVKRDYARESTVFYPGVDPRKYKGGEYKDYVLCVSRLVSTKRIPIVIKSAKYLKNKNIKIVIVGTGGLEECMNNIAKKYKNVELKGFVSEEELRNLYANCLASIYIPINEDYGYTPVEAAMCSKATIGSNEGALKETVLDNKTGFLIDDVTPKKVAEKIDLLANDKNLAINMGKAARVYCKRFELNKTNKVMDKMIQEVMKDQPKKREGKNE